MNIFTFKDLPKIIETPTMEGPYTKPSVHQEDWTFGGTWLSVILEMAKDPTLGPSSQHQWRTFCADQFTAWTDMAGMCELGEGPEELETIFYGDMQEIHDITDKWMELYLEALRGKL